MANLFSNSFENKSFSSKKVSISSIKFGIASHKSTESISHITSKKKNLCDILENFEADNNMSFELEDKNNMSFEVANNNEEFLENLKNTLQNYIRHRRQSSRCY